MAKIKYRTTLEACSCPDAYYRRRVCKHIRRLRAAHDLIQSQKAFNKGFEEGRIAR